MMPYQGEVAQITIQPGSQFSALTSVEISSIISAFIALLMIFASLLFFFQFMLGGIKWMLASGSSEKVDNAKSQITSALIGLMIVFSAWALLSLIRTMFGVDLTSLQIPSFQP